MSIVRRIGAVAVVIAGAGAFWFFCVHPFRCNVLKKTQLRSTQFAFNHAGTTSATIRARENVDALLDCADPICRDVSLDMLLAANYRVLRQYDRAIAQYRDALRLDHRPEIYLNLAEVEIATGDRATAREHLLRAVLFNPWLLSGIDDGLLREDIAREVIALYPDHADYIRYIATIPPSGP